MPNTTKSQTCISSNNNGHPAAIQPNLHTHGDIECTSKATASTQQFIYTALSHRHTHIQTHPERNRTNNFYEFSPVIVRKFINYLIFSFHINYKVAFKYRFSVVLWMWKANGARNMGFLHCGFLFPDIHTHAALARSIQVENIPVGSRQPT